MKKINKPSAGTSTGGLEQIYLNIEYLEYQHVFCCLELVAQATLQQAPHASSFLKPLKTLNALKPLKLIVFNILQWC